VVAGVLDGQSNLDAFKADHIRQPPFSTREKMIVPFRWKQSAVQHSAKTKALWPPQGRTRNIRQHW